MKCTNCGEIIVSDEASFCVYCGNKVEQNIVNLEQIKDNVELSVQQVENTLEVKSVEDANKKFENIDKNLCINCNEILEENMDFCIYCGNKVEENIINLEQIKDDVELSVQQVENTIEVKSVDDTNKKLESIRQKKSNIIFELGLVTYKKIRNGEITDYQLSKISEDIIGLDYVIYNMKCEKEGINNKNSIRCTCGNDISKSDKFCNECGKKVVLLDLIKENKICSNCEVIIEDDYSFCNCCGYKIN
ncbi:MAG: double zinc ribbon domain-containing protein [Clostridium sp.]